MLSHIRISVNIFKYITKACSKLFSCFSHRQISLVSCGNYSNVVAEALTEGSTGGLLSSEITSSRVPTTWFDGEGNTYYSVNASIRTTRRSLRTWHVWTSFLRGNRETLHLALDVQKVRMVNPKWGTTMEYKCRESDSFIVSEKPANKIRDNKRMAEEVEKRRLAEGNLVEQN